MAIMAETEDLRFNLTILNKTLTSINMRINVMNGNDMHNVELNGHTTEQAKCFKYLRMSIEEKGKLHRELNDRMRKQGAV